MDSSQKKEKFPHHQNILEVNNIMLTQQLESLTTMPLKNQLWNSSQS